MMSPSSPEEPRSIPWSCDQYLEALFEKDRLAYLGGFLQGFIHNVNGPLQNLSMLTEVLERSTESLDRYVRTHCGSTPPGEWEALMERQRARFQQLDKQIASLAEMLKDFMVVHEIERSESEVDVNFVLMKLATVFRSDLFFKHQLNVELNLAKNLPLARVPGCNLIPALVHVFKNAVTAMRCAPQKQLTIESRAEEGRIIIMIRDSGCGFGEEGSPLEPCAAGWPRDVLDTERGEKHFGFGLYAVHSLLGSHGGTLRVERVGEETVATLDIPPRS